MNQVNVNNCNNYQVKRSQSFERTYDALIKKHYHKNRQALDKFKKLIEEYENDVAKSPCSPEVSNPEPYPHGTSEDGYELRKKRWTRLPGLDGSARFGRLIFLVYHPKKIIYFIWIYTHAQYSEPNSRPPDPELKNKIDSAKEEISNELTSN